MSESLSDILPETDPERFVRLLLDEYGLPSDPLVSSSGWANDVWLAPTHVVRLSSGRFRDAFAHEHAVIALLPLEVPHAGVVARGRIGEREWLIQERVSGRSLYDAWPTMDEPERSAVARQLATALKALHAIPLPPGFSNPALGDALTPGGPIRNAYHAPPHAYSRLIDAATNVPGVEAAFLDGVRAFIEARLDAFNDDSEALVHGDVHFSNLLCDGERLTAILDFEGARPAAPDQELDTLLRQIREPDLYRPPGAQGGLSSTDLTGFIDAFASAYPELFDHPRLSERLEVYEAMWHLVQLLHFPPGSSGPDPYGHLKTLTTFGSRKAQC